MQAHMREDLENIRRMGVSCSVLAVFSLLVEEQLSDLG